MSEELMQRWRKFMDDQPCPICNGIEGCDHSVFERMEANIALIDAGQPISTTQGNIG